MCVTTVQSADDTPVGEHAAQNAPPPRLPTQAQATPEAARGALRLVRSFHLGGPAEGLDAPSDDTLPILLHRFRDARRVRSDYPLLLLPAPEPRAAVPLGEWLRATAEHREPELADARLVTDNLTGIEFAARAHTDEAPRDAAALLAEAATDAASSRSLRDAERRTLADDLAKLAESLPEGTTAVGLDANTPVRLAVHAAVRRDAERRAALTERLGALRSRLRRLLDEDKLRRAQDDPSLLAGALGDDTSGINPGALASVMGKRPGPTRISERRTARINDALATFDAFLDNPGPDPVVVLHGGELDGLAGLPGNAKLVQVELPCAEAAARFDALADGYAPLALAARIAELELTGSFDETLYGPMIESFARGSLSPDEVRELPAVVAVETVARLTGADMPHITRALLSGRPVRLLLCTEPADNPIADDPLSGFRFEPGSFGLGHREAQVHQTSAARPAHLLEGFARCLNSTRPSLHVVSTGLCTGGETSPVGASLHDGAALEARAHTLFRFDPEAGTSWADRLDFSGNEQTEADWPKHELDCIDGGGAPLSLPLAFTFADFALLEPALRDGFRVVPDTCATNDLTPIDQFPLDEPESAGRRIPFVWGVDAAGRAARLVVSRPLIDACRDRLANWRTLRELAGVQNAYVDRAVAAERETLGAESARRMDQLRDEHTAELERVRRETAAEAMHKLAEVLLEVDLSTVAPAPRSRTAAPAPAAPTDAQATPESTAEPAPVAEEEDAGFDDPYIDSPLCTSCNDCMAINPQVFVYNTNKQAVIANPDAGTYLQLVQAAEKCPARCIHPGKPRNPDEANLDELIARAKPFN